MTTIAFLLAERVPPVTSPVLVEVFDRLRIRGFDVEAGIPEQGLRRVDDLVADADLVVLKSHTELALALAGVLHGAGVRILNPYEHCLLAQDKTTAARILREAALPVPGTWLTGDVRLAAPLLTHGPLIVKPHRGHRGVGVSVVRSYDDLADISAGLGSHDGPMVVQEYVEGLGEDLKVYVVGDEVFAVRKPFSPDSFTRPGRPVPVAEEVREIALRCGHAFGLGLFGIDVIESPRGPVVVDVNYFPGYKGVPDAAAFIADYIARYAVHVLAGSRAA